VSEFSARLRCDDAPSDVKDSGGFESTKSIRDTLGVKANDSWTLHAALDKVTSLGFAPKPASSHRAYTLSPEREEYVEPLV